MDAGPRPYAPTRAALAGLCVGAALAVAAHWVYVFAFRNVHTVLPGLAHRCAQPTPELLRTLIRDRGVRTVVNLRGPCPNLPWYRAESDVSASLDVNQEDLVFSAMRLPSRKSLAQLVEVIDRAEKPLLFHCQQGADRTGLASVVAALMLTEETLDACVGKNLGPATGHLPVGKTAKMDDFFVLYRDWLAGVGLTHDPAVFRVWATAYYDGDVGAADIVRLDRAKPERLKPWKTTVKVTNTSSSSWHLKPGTNAGVSVRYHVFDRDHGFRVNRRAGLFRRSVQPGESFEADLVIPALPQGSYTLLVDLADEQHATFNQLGNDPLVLPVEVP